MATISLVIPENFRVNRRSFAINLIRRQRQRSSAANATTSPTVPNNDIAIRRFARRRRRLTSVPRELSRRPGKRRLVRTAPGITAGG
jgi:hypothetical protein